MNTAGFGSRVRLRVRSMNPIDFGNNVKQEVENLIDLNGSVGVKGVDFLIFTFPLRLL